MQVSVENTGPLERKVRVEVPEEKIASEVKNRLQSLSRTTRIQGFRPGKAPLKVVEKRYGDKVRQEVVGEVVQSSFYEALSKEKLRPASRPEIDPLDDNRGKGVVYTATFEVYPEFTPAPVAELEIEKPVCAVTDTDVDNMIEVIRKQQSTLKAVDRPAKMGDVLKIDFQGTIDGEAFEGGEARDFRIELGTGRFIAGFEEGLVGTKTGQDLALELKFPEDYHHENLAGKPVKFDVTVKEINEPVLPELDDALFASMGVKEGGLDAFRAEVRRNMEREAEQAVLDRSKNNVLDALNAANTIELPQALVRNEAENLRNQLRNNLQMQGIDADQYMPNDEQDATLQKRAERKVTLQLVISDLVKNEGIKAEPARVRQMIEKVAEGYEDPNEVINWYYSDRNRLAEVEALALEDEVVQWIMSKAKVTDTKIPFDDLMNKGQTETN
ncbi:MAG TPA: trigger factor [Gammaproteobacteria bacterium]|nr:trigger factor [Gammaproteobacteria bacterium]